MIRALLQKNRFLVFDFDYLQMTALHWACKKGHIQAAKILIEHDSDIDAEDIVGRTPLYIAFDMCHNKIAQYLLYEQASPWSTDKINYQNLYDHNP